jgi:hypothetical protein
MKTKHILVIILLVFLAGISFNLSAAETAPSADDSSIMKGLGTFFSTYGLQLLAQQRYELETGFITSGYNDIRIPGNGGDMFSLTDDLKASTSMHFRFRLIQPIAEKHRLIFTYAPMKIKSDGYLNEANIVGDLDFAGLMVPADVYPGMEFESTYRLDCYRQAYQYDIMKIAGTNVSVGLSAEIRDEAVILRGAGGYEGKRSANNVNVLGNFALSRQFNLKTDFVVEGDILFASQNRAEDIFIGATWKILRNSKLKAGYRFIERSTDTSDIYNKALFHILTVGADFDL